MGNTKGGRGAFRQEGFLKGAMGWWVEKREAAAEVTCAEAGPGPGDSLGLTCPRNGKESRVAGR